MNKHHDDLNTFIEKFATVYASKNRKYKVERDDLIQEGRIALWDAERSYSGPECEFDAYAKASIRNAFYHYAFKMSTGKRLVKCGSEEWNLHQRPVESLDGFIEDNVLAENDSSLHVDEDSVFGDAIIYADFTKTLSSEENAILKHRIVNGCVGTISFMKKNKMSKRQYYDALNNIRVKANRYFGREA